MSAPKATGVGRENRIGNRTGEQASMRVRWIAKGLVTTLALVAFALVAVPVAGAQIAFSSVGASLREASSFFPQAGAHSDFTTKVAFTTDASERPFESARTIEFDLPRGLTGNPIALPTCAVEKLANPGAGVAGCIPESQVGKVTISLNLGGQVSTGTVGLYNLEHPANVPALFGFNYLGAIVTVVPNVRPGDYGISAGSFSITQALPLVSVETVLWGVPASPVHDSERYPAGALAPGATSLAPLTPFITNPTSCPGTAASLAARADSWQDPGRFATATLDSDMAGEPFIFEGCESLPFNPTASVQPTNRAADAPAGVDVDIEVPQSAAPDGLATSHLRSTIVSFPPGISVSPSSAAGLASCSPAQIGLGNNQAPTCPDSSKIGSVRVDTPFLEEPLVGDVILASQGDNPFHSLLAVYLSIPGPGFVLKLPGKVEADANTGRLTAVFDDLPQLPFSDLHLHLNSGPRAPLTTPRECGTYEIQTRLVPWAGTATAIRASRFTVDQGCDAAAKFTPSLEAGATNPAAGVYSPLVLKVTRPEGQQNIAQISPTLPGGELAKLAGVPLCSDAQAAGGSCDAASRIGTATVSAGPGSNPVFVPQAGRAPTAIYLAGPYKGAPYSLVVEVPAEAGPFNLGTVAVRTALRVDPVSAQVTAVSDPLPQILQGIPIEYRTIFLDIDRPDFTLNPTSCEPTRVEAEIVSDRGATAGPSSPFQLGSCASLGFKPKLSFKLRGGTERGDYPALTATLRARPGDANLDRASVTLPHSEFLAQNHINTVCTRVQFAAEACPKGSIYGYAKAVSPLLDKPLSGPIYLRSSDNPLPDIVAALHGQINLDVQGRIDSVNGGIRSTFDVIPDAPVSSFTLAFKGGSKSLLVNSRNICGVPGRANAKFTGQNGKTLDLRPQLRSGCGASHGSQSR